MWAAKASRPIPGRAAAEVASAQAAAAAALGHHHHQQASLRAQVPRKKKKKLRQSRGAPAQRSCTAVSAPAPLYEVSRHIQAENSALLPPMCPFGCSDWYSSQLKVPTICFYIYTFMRELILSTCLQSDPAALFRHRAAAAAAGLPLGVLGSSHPGVGPAHFGEPGFGHQYAVGPVVKAVPIAAVLIAGQVW